MPRLAAWRKAATLFHDPVQAASGAVVHALELYTPHRGAANVGLRRLGIQARMQAACAAPALCLWRPGQSPSAHGGTLAGRLFKSSPNPCCLSIRSTE